MSFFEILNFGDMDLRAPEELDARMALFEKPWMSTFTRTKKYFRTPSHEKVVSKFWNFLWKRAWGGAPPILLHSTVLLTVGCRVVLQLDFGKVCKFWEKFVNFWQIWRFWTVFRAPWSDSDNFWICWGSKMIFSKIIFLGLFVVACGPPQIPIFWSRDQNLPDFRHFFTFSKMEGVGWSPPDRKS